MKAKEIQELLDFISKSGLDEVYVETDSFKVNVKRHSYTVADESVVQPQKALKSQPIVSTTVFSEPPQTNTPAETEQTTTNTKKSDEPSFVTIKSPMIGTFYRSSNPDTPAFVSIGDEIKKGQTVCIIEAMKLFNEIESEFAGKIVKVLVDNASPVEYDQPLFLIDPS